MIWIFEDSSKVGIGGGQRVTLSVLHAVRDQDVRLIDSTLGLHHAAAAEGLRVRFTQVPFRGKSVRATSSFSFPASEAVGTVFQLRRAVQRVAPLVRRERPLAFYCPSRKGLLLALLVRRRARVRIPVVYHAHTAMPPGILGWLFVRFVARTCDLVICVSRFVMRQMRGRLVLIPNPVRLSAAPAAREARPQPIVGFVGRPLPVKGFDVYLNVARANGDRIRFRAFMPDDPGPLHAPVEVWTGRAPDEIYPNMDVLLMCSRAPESFSLVALEACAFDVPVVFPFQPALLEILTPGVSGEAYDEHTVEAITARIDEVLGSRDAYHPLSAVDWERFDPARFETSIRKVLLDAHHPHDDA